MSGAALAQTWTASKVAELRAAANAGDAGAQFILGNTYLTGQGVPQDDVEAVRWYRLAAEQGQAAAQSSLGAMYANGRGGVPQDDVEAVRWIRQAAEQGYALAQWSLGLMYATAQGVPKDDAEAYKWLNLATTYADASNREEFGEMRDTLAELLTPEQRADAQRRAREFFEAHPPE